MRVTYLIQREATPPQSDGAPLILALSDWDGVHRGHVAMARRAAELGAVHGARAVALLPWPSPESVDDTPAARLTTLEERIARLDALGCFDTLYILPSPEEPQQDGAASAGTRGQDTLRALLAAAHAVVVEPQRSGPAVTRLWPTGLAPSALAGGVRVEQGPWTENAGDLSAEIRELVAAGRMREVTAALGYTYTVTGEVVGGDRRGRLLGFPTANVRAEPAKLVPANGIYAAWASLPGSGDPWPTVISIGVRPTFGAGARRQVEAYLLDATADLYGVQLRLEFVDYLRAELRFESVEALIAQIRADCEQARETLRAEAAHGATPSRQDDGGQSKPSASEVRA